MSSHAAAVPAEAFGLSQALNLSLVRSSQGWILRLMRRDGPAITRMLWRILGREQDVLDAYQECICKLIALHDRQGSRPHRGYVFRTAMNIALDARRHRKVRSEHLDSAARSRTPAGSGLSTPVPDGQVQSLREAIADLPDRLRDVVVLRDLAEMSYRDVGRILGLTPGTARVYRREAVVALSTRLMES